MPRALRFIVHNWPLKLGAVALATLLYGGLVLSQTTSDFTSPVQIQIDNAPDDVVVLSEPGAVTRIRYVAPPDLGLRIDGQTFRASVDLDDIEPTGQPVFVQVSVVAIDDRIQILGIEPEAIPMTIDHKASKSVPVRAALLPLPSGLDAAEPEVEQSSAIVTGPKTVVDAIREVQAPVAVDASGIDVNQLVTLVPIDLGGQAVGPSARVEVEPTQVRVRVSVFTDRRSKTLPIRPNVIGTPAAGFEVASVDVTPAVVSVEGDANDLAALESADTEPVSVAGASSQVVQTVRLALPGGVEALGADNVQVTVRLRPVTGTRTFDAGLLLVGASPDKGYALSIDRVLVTIGGSVADLDRLSGATIVLSVDVTGLQDGTHSVPVSANLQTGLTLVGASPNPIEVTVTSSPAPPSPSPGPSPAT